MSVKPWQQIFLYIMYILCFALAIIRNLIYKDFSNEDIKFIYIEDGVCLFTLVCTYFIVIRKFFRHISEDESI